MRQPPELQLDPLITLNHCWTSMSFLPLCKAPSTTSIGHFNNNHRCTNWTRYGKLLYHLLFPTFMRYKRPRTLSEMAPELLLSPTNTHIHCLISLFFFTLCRAPSITSRLPLLLPSLPSQKVCLLSSQLVWLLVSWCKCLP